MNQAVNVQVEVWKEKRDKDMMNLKKILEQQRDDKG